MTYLPVLAMMIVGIGISVSILLLTSCLGRGFPSLSKNNPFECGVPPYGTAQHRFSVRFYLVAILFLLFDVEIVFLIPWALVFKKFIAINYFILVEILVFSFVFLVGYFYVLRKGALDWE